MDKPRVAIAAGDISGDVHGASLAGEIARIVPGVELFGVGGERMERAGVRLLHRMDRLAVIGFVEVLRHIPEAHRVMKDILHSIATLRPRVLVLIDYPGFNLRLARAAKREGVRVVYYIGPQVWAWGGWRIRRIAETVDKMVVTFPFEIDLYRRAGVDVEFVGHPLLDLVRSNLDRRAFAARVGIDPERPIVGLLPGSRAQELRRLVPLMLGSAEEMSRRRSDLQFVVACAPGDCWAFVAEKVKGQRFELRVVKGLTHEVMSNADLLLVASGTATLEAAILGTPMLILYKVSFLSWLILRQLIKVPSIGLVNILAGREIVPEFVQFGAKRSRIVDAAFRMLDGDAERSRVEAELQSVVTRLGTAGASARAARIVADLMGRGEWGDGGEGA